MNLKEYFDLFSIIIQIAFAATLGIIFTIMYREHNHNPSSSLRSASEKTTLKDIENQLDLIMLAAAVLTANHILSFILNDEWGGMTLFASTIIFVTTLLIRDKTKTKKKNQQTPQQES